MFLCNYIYGNTFCQYNKPKCNKTNHNNGIPNILLHTVVNITNIKAIIQIQMDTDAIEKNNTNIFSEERCKFALDRTTDIMSCVFRDVEKIRLLPEEQKNILTNVSESYNSVAELAKQLNLSGEFNILHGNVLLIYSYDNTGDTENVISNDETDYINNLINLYTNKCLDCNITVTFECDMILQKSMPPVYLYEYYFLVKLL